MMSLMRFLGLISMDKAHVKKNTKLQVLTVQITQIHIPSIGPKTAKKHFRDFF